MRRTARGLVVAVVMVGAAALAPSIAEAGDEPIPYACNETSGTNTVPEFTADLLVTAPGAPATAKIFQPLTWTFDIDEPELAPPLSVNLEYLRVRIPRPANLTNVAAQVIAAPGETPNPALAQVSVQVSETEIVVQLPATLGTNNYIRAGSDGSLTWPSNILGQGQPVVLPQVRVTGTPTPAAAGTDLEWSAPTIESATTIIATHVTIACTPVAEPDPVVTSTAVGTNRQLCDGKPVTVQLGFNAPAGGNDVIQGTAANNNVNGLAGNDRFCGLNGNDTWRGGAGNDRAVGGAGNDNLRGDAGDDRLQGDAGTDTLTGDGGRDTLIGGTQRDTCNGGPQTDTATTCEVRQSIP